ncbi:MAG: hypothetical protein ACC661_05350, partial [Verrucomicrobiales bacterium]
MTYRILCFASRALLMCSLAFAGESRADQKTKAPPEESAALTQALDYLAEGLTKDPHYEKTPTRRFYAPIIYAPLAGLAFLGNGDTRVEGPHAEAIRRV